MESGDCLECGVSCDDVLSSSSSFKLSPSSDNPYAAPASTDGGCFELVALGVRTVRIGASSTLRFGMKRSVLPYSFLVRGFRLMADVGSSVRSDWGRPSQAGRGEAVTMLRRGLGVEGGGDGTWIVSVRGDGSFGLLRSGSRPPASLVENALLPYCFSGVEMVKVAILLLKLMKKGACYDVSSAEIYSDDSDVE